MKFSRSYVFGLATLGSAAALAGPPTMTSNGYTGLAITPNAHLLGWGRAEASYDNQLPGVVAQPSGHNYVLGFGLFPNMEFAGRLATNDLRSNCFAVNCGARDLSASAKVAIGLDQANRFRAAAGVTDFGGAATYFRTYYGVLTFNEGPVEASAGFARRDGAGIAGSRSPLNGAFAAAAWQPLPLVRAHVEYADGNAWAGVRLFAPQQWLPEDWALSVGANARLKQTPLTDKSWWTASVSIPLYKVPPLPGRAKSPLPAVEGQPTLPAYEARAAAPASAAASAPSASSPTADRDDRGTSPPQGSGSRLQALADALERRGLEDIWVGELPDRSIVVRVNNGAFQWNTIDAVGAALGAVATTLGREPSGYRLIVTQRQVPIVAVTGRTDCLARWVTGEESTCAAGQLSTAGTDSIDPLTEGATWHVQQQRPRWRTVRFGISPALRTTVGTEVGAFDYSFGANLRAQLPMWAGASLDWTHTVPMANSTNFEPAGLFADRRLRSGLERLSFTQTTRLPIERWLSADAVQAARFGLSSVTAQATVGRVGRYFDGAIGSLRWEPGNGAHRWSAQAGAFRNNEFNGGLGPLRGLEAAYPVLGSYRYNVTATRTFLEATAGQFMSNDRGFQVGIRQWFSDVSVGLSYKRTRVSSTGTTQIAQLELTLPIGPRQDISLVPGVQLTSEPRFSHGVGTVIRNPAGNFIRTNVATPPPVPSIDAVFNSDRSGLVYFEDNIRRIRDAAR